MIIKWSFDITVYQPTKYWDDLLAKEEYPQSGFYKAIKEKKKAIKEISPPSFEETVNNQSSIKHCRNYLSTNHQVA